VTARRCGSPLDSYIEILDAAGHAMSRATLRCIAMTHIGFNDCDSRNSQIRLEAWNELAVGDFIWVGDELLRVRNLPKNPDDSCQLFMTGDSDRVAFLGTTPRHVSMGLPVYKVLIYPPRTEFPPNGFPIIQLPYRDDDGGPRYGTDSHLLFDVPYDGEYVVRIGDSCGNGGPSYAYRLTVKPLQPDFVVKFSPAAPTVARGNALPMAVTLKRIDGFEGPVDVDLLDLPDGFTRHTRLFRREKCTSLFLFGRIERQTLPQKPPDSNSSHEGPLMAKRLCTR
jgi:hypothetical protein